ncbi:MAG: hypothetical protein E7387_08415 [Ruminococcaceae bacterium]|nr:hypothetical protein [Oscillospiraceae bacterium]
MLKRCGSIILSVILCVSVLSGCQTKKMFGSETEMKTYVDGVWESEDTTYAVSNGKILNFSKSTVDYIWSEFSSSLEYDFSQYTAQKFYEDIYLNHFSILRSNFVYDYENSKITSGSAEWLEFLDDGTAIHDKQVFTKISDSSTYVEDEVKAVFEENIEELIFKEKYPDLPSSREVQYDKWGHFGDNFIITGTAELDDYYNWGYENYEYGYFCINIRPSGGTYSDEWYVYANRNSFSDLYASLQSGSKNVTLVAQMVYVDTGSNNMATLVDYKK